MSRTQPSADNGAAQPSGSANSGLLPQRWILVVDDDASVREMLGRVLFAEGYGAWLAADGIEALTIAGVAQVDLVLLDLNLPKKSGWDTFERLTAANPLRPVIIITARSGQLVTAMASGAAALLEKPLDFPTLLRTIGEVLSESIEARLVRIAGQPGQSDFHYTPKPQPHGQGGIEPYS
jgi:DNA-binding response OmpR family regulator